MQSQMNLNRFGESMEHAVASQESELFEGEYTTEDQGSITRTVVRAADDLSRESLGDPEANTSAKQRSDGVHKAEA